MRFNITVRVLIVISIVLLIVTRVFGDEVMLDNGDTLSGTVVGMEDGVLKLDTGYSEPVKMQMKRIKKIQTTNPVEIHFNSGEIFKGILNTDDEGKFLVQQTEAREITVIYWDNVKAINPSPVKWRGNITIGAETQSGNTDKKGASVGVEAIRRTGNDRFSLRFLHNYAEESDVITTRNTYGAVKYDYFFTKKLYGNLGVELLNDTFKDLELRTIVSTGLGYQVLDEQVRSVAFEFGLAYFSENRREDEDEDWLSARAATNVMWTLFNAITLSDYFVIYPSLEESKYTLRNEANLTSPLGTQWALKLSYIVDYDSKPPQNTKKSDEQWILALQYSF